MTNEELISTLSVNYTKKCIRLDKVTKENLEFYDLIQDLKGQLVQAQQDIRVANEYIRKLEKAHYE